MRTSTYKNAAATLNFRRADIAPWIRDGAIIYLSEDKPREIPAGTPAWYLPYSGDIYVCVKQIMETMHGTIGPSTLTEAFEELLLGSSTYVVDRFDGLTSAPQLTAATILGLIQHEAAHSRWSHWMQATGDGFKGRDMKAVMDVVILFEELRIEHQVVKYGKAVEHGKTTPYLLSKTARPLQLSFAWLSRESSDSFFESGTKRDVAGAWALMYGRYLAGVIDRSIVESVHVLAETKIGVDDLKALENILLDAIALEPVNGVHRPLISLARRWLEIVGEAGDGEVSIEILVEGSSRGDSDSDSGGSSDADEDSDDEDSGDGAGARGSKSTDGEDDNSEDGVADGEGGEESAGESDGDSGDELDGASDSDEAAFDKDEYDIKPDHGHSEDAREGVDKHIDREMKDLLENVIDSMADEISRPVQTNIRLADSVTESRKVMEKLMDYGTIYHGAPRHPREKRWQVEPTAEDRRETMQVVRQLERLSIPAVTKRKLPHELPPGRVNMRAAMAAAVDREAGRASQARPWKRTKRTHSETRPTVVGIMTDISGSMGWAEKATARFGYIFSNASARVAARSAVVAFGEGVEVMVRPGERLSKLRYRDADGGTEHFDEGAAALDGILHLTELRNAVRLVMITSDGHFVRPFEEDKTLRWIEQWRKAGVHVVWCGFEATYREHFKNKLAALGVTIDPSRDLVEAGMRTLTKFI